MKALVFPKDHNPYQELLYVPMRKQFSNLTVTYCKRYPYIGALSFPIVAIARRFQGYKICHVHWPAFTISKPVPFHKELSNMLFGFSVRLLKVLGYKTVWTVHNVVPHEPQTSNDLGNARLLTKNAAAIIVHSKYTISQMDELGLETGHSHIIPHGSYVDTYPDIINRTEARKKLGIEKSERVVLFFGKVRGYKGIDDLLQAWQRVEKSGYRLIIAGYCEEPELLETIQQAIKDSKRINFYNKHIADPDVATYFNAADVVCLPFKSITTSGSALLALSFGKPLVAPKAGALLDLPDSLGYLYQPHKPNALEQQLSKALTNPAELTAAGKSARAYAEALSWDNIARMTYDLYTEVLNRPVGPKS